MSDAAAPAGVFDTLISAQDLRRLIDCHRPLVILDASFDLSDAAAGELAHRAAHLPGALHVHLDRDLSGPKTGRNGRHPLPDRAVFAATAGHWGITPNTQVVVYDCQGAMFAARVWWMLRWLGHAPVAVLDGGLTAWQAAGFAVDSAGVSPRPQVAYPIRTETFPLVRTIDADTLQGQLDHLALIDARSPERFRGEVEPLDAQAGHIPGARNRYFKDNLAADGRFKPAEMLRAELLPLIGARPASGVVNQCGSGVTACHNLLAMAIAGIDGAALYAGSWSEWSSDPQRPVARG
ncbi:MAG: sulfurtransferase [Burkholderiales bacterium PBB1]|nr:MAG: sulfurtransferase [Burkholderiales bacterium PBB1]